jgi:hypothetical protein|tara:strand:+ start:2010 stop:2327 length:318 start_codon:yes stop_codon:yes gene_type:complete
LQFNQLPFKIIIILGSNFLALDKLIRKQNEKWERQFSLGKQRNLVGKNNLKSQKLAIFEQITWQHCTFFTIRITAKKQQFDVIIVKNNRLKSVLNCVFWYRALLE